MRRRCTAKTPLRMRANERGEGILNNLTWRLAPTTARCIAIYKTKERNLAFPRNVAGTADVDDAVGVTGYIKN